MISELVSELVENLHIINPSLSEIVTCKLNFIVRVFFDCLL